MKLIFLRNTEKKKNVVVCGLNGNINNKYINNIVVHQPGRSNSKKQCMDCIYFSEKYVGEVLKQSTIPVLFCFYRISVTSV